jgi:pimeloyl-ACP methyl ester carboxylesterase
VAFVVLHAGASVTPARQGQLHLEHELRAYGVPEAQIAEGLAFQRLDDEFTRSGKGWNELEATYRKAAEAKAPWVYADLRPANDEFRTMFRRILDFDPIPSWRKVKCPVLAFFGELDLQVPPLPNADLLRQTLTEAGHSRFRIVVLPKANHLFLQAGNGTMAEYPGLRAFEPTYFRQLAAWLGEVVVSRQIR